MSDTLQTLGPSGLIRTANDINAKLREWKERFHVLSPFTQLGGEFGPGIVLTVSSIKLDPTVNEYGNGTDTYFSKAFMKAPEGQNAPSAQRAPSKVGLLKIAQNAGIRWTPAACVRTDDGSAQHYWSFAVAGEYLTPDGIWLQLTGNAEVDLRDGSAQMLAMGNNPKQLAMARQFGLANAESKAKNRAIRSLGMATTYTVDELNRKPFLMLRATFHPAADDEVGRRVFATVAMGASHMLYGQNSAMTLPPPSFPPVNQDAAIIDVTAAEHVQTFTPNAEQTQQAETDRTAVAQVVQQQEQTTTAAPARRQLFIVGVETRPIRRMVRGTLHEVPRHYIVDSNGVEHATDQPLMKAAATRLMEQKIPVDLTTSTNAAGTSIIEELSPETGDAY